MQLPIPNFLDQAVSTRKQLHKQLHRAAQYYLYTIMYNI